MRFAAPNPRALLLGFAAALVAVLLLGAIGAPPAEAGKDRACKRHGDKKAQNLKKKQARNAIYCFVNRKRNANGRGDLRRDSRLVDAAQRHSFRMATKSCFSHQCPGERSLLDRLKKVNYIISGLSRWAYGENIALGGDRYGSPRNIVSSWMKSSGHRANILSGTFREMGVGFRTSGSKGYYTLDFGLRIG